jgi:hypothetical protein
VLIPTNLYRCESRKQQLLKTVRCNNGDLVSFCERNGHPNKRLKTDDPIDMITHLLFFNDHALEKRDNIERRVGQPTLLSRYVDPGNLTMNWAFPSVLPCQLSPTKGGGRGYCMLYQGFVGTTAAQGWEGRE